MITSKSIISRSIEDILIDQMGHEWYTILYTEFEKPYMIKLIETIKNKRKEGIVYPPKGEVFNAFKLTPYHKVKVVILGQDPYLNEFEAHGIAFSTFNGQYTPSLRQIEKAVRKDEGYTSDYKWNNNLIRWSKQGIFLLNTVLTVDKGKSDSHKNLGWETFTKRVIELLDVRDVIFLLWGANARALKSSIKKSKVIECEHPQAPNYQGRDWNNNECFKKVNNILNKEIQW